MTSQPEKPDDIGHLPDRARELCWDKLPLDEYSIVAIKLEPAEIAVLPGNLKLAIERAVAELTKGDMKPKDVSYGDACIMLDDHKPADESDRACDDNAADVPPLRWTRIVPK